MMRKEKYMSKGNSLTDVSQRMRLIFRFFDCVDVVVLVGGFYVAFN
jgi:hypothetical protein